ncbi:MAG: MFS transporter [Synechococcales bacterium]|nr:MFS transporter [Synechococcales bacterium]
MSLIPPKLRTYFPDLDGRVWILAGGRLLSQLGNGFTLFYAPIFFVNQVGLSATAVGLGLGSGSISGVVGRFLGGSAADDPRWGRRKILLWSAAISALADVALATAFNLPTFILGNLLMGLGIGLYWPATEAVVADLTTDLQRNEAFALVRLADSIGLSLGIVLGGALIELTGQYRALFVIDGFTYLVFFVIIYGAIAETLKPQTSHPQILAGWRTALGDRFLLIYALVNILFTLYLAQVQSSLPLYFANFAGTNGFSTAHISALFTGHVILTALFQLPVARGLNRFRRTHALSLSALLWGVGFCLIFATGTVSSLAMIWAGAALTVLAIATVTYLPAASAFVVEIAPESLRGVYLSVNSQCWAIGYFLGPPIGGWALDQTPLIAHGIWLVLALSVLGVVGVLVGMGRRG